jgi:hypothetical protein
MLSQACIGVIWSSSRSSLELRASKRSAVVESGVEVSSVSAGAILERAVRDESGVGVLKFDAG